MSGAPRPTRRLDPCPITVSRPLVLLRLGYRQASQVPAKTARLLDEVVAAAAGLLEPRAAWTAVEVEREADGVLRLGGSLHTRSRSLDERLAGCDEAILFAATIGPRLEEWARVLADGGEMTRSLLADAYGSSAAIALGLSVEEAVARELATRGRTATKRYAPGYGDFELQAQGALLDLVGTAPLGITLTEDHLMLPAKSISGVIGAR